MNESVIDWVEVIFRLIWIVVVVILIPLIKKFKPIVIQFLQKKIGASNLEVISNILSDLILSVEKNITGNKVGSIRKEYIMELLKQKGLVDADNEEIISNLIDGMCEQLTAEGLINNK